MDIFFQDPSDVPLPPEEVRIRRLSADPYPDGRRVRVYLELTPFLKRPNGEVNVFNLMGDEVASLSIIETIDPKMEMTVHLRGQDTSGEYRVEARVFYLEEAAPQAGQEEIDLQDRKQIVVDQAQANFEITF
jgi:hypothetical protein